MKTTATAAIVGVNPYRRLLKTLIGSVSTANPATRNAMMYSLRLSTNAAA